MLRIGVLPKLREDGGRGPPTPLPATSGERGRWAEMNWSIIARDSVTCQIGIAVATKFFAVGARVPHIAAGFGGIATQALVNPYYGIDGVKLLREGKSPHDIVKTLTAADHGRESRQLHVMDAG